MTTDMLVLSTSIVVVSIIAYLWGVYRTAKQMQVDIDEAYRQVDKIKTMKEQSSIETGRKYNDLLETIDQREAELARDHITITDMRRKLEQYDAWNVYVTAISGNMLTIKKRAMTTKEMMDKFLKTYDVPRKPMQWEKALRQQGFTKRRTTVNKVRAQRWYNGK